jgi:hypothetical protein
MTAPPTPAPAEDLCVFCERDFCDNDCCFADRHGRLDSHGNDGPVESRKTAAQWRAEGAAEAEAREQLAYGNIAAHAWNMGAGDDASLVIAAGVEKLVRAESQLAAATERAVKAEALLAEVLAEPNDFEISLDALTDRIRAHLEKTP